MTDAQAMELAQEWLDRHAKEYPDTVPDNGCVICQLARAVIALNERLALAVKTIDDAPHAPNCWLRLQIIGVPCNCFKSVLAQIEPKEPGK